MGAKGPQHFWYNHRNTRQKHLGVIKTVSFDAVETKAVGQEFVRDSSSVVFKKAFLLTRFFTFFRRLRTFLLRVQRGVHTERHRRCAVGQTASDQEKTSNSEWSGECSVELSSLFHFVDSLFRRFFAFIVVRFHLLSDLRSFERFLHVQG